MAENNVTRTLVRAAVARARREIEEDQRRAMRRITDMGRQFSKSRFQILVFDIIQEFLSDDGSIYYAMTENLLQTTDHDSLADFGVNLAYMSWTHGARILRRSQKELGVCLPWEISLCYDPGREDSLTPDEIRRIILTTSKCDNLMDADKQLDKFIAEFDMLTAILVQAGTNFVGCYVAMWAAEKFLKQEKNET